MALPDWELNLFHSDPKLLQRGPDAEYERAAATIRLLGDANRLRLLHALIVGEGTAQRAAVWAGLPQAYAERELAALSAAGVLERRRAAGGPVFSPRDGHLVVALHVTLAHGRETAAERHPRLLADRRGPRALVV